MINIYIEHFKKSKANIGVALFQCIFYHLSYEMYEVWLNKSTEVPGRFFNCKKTKYWNTYKTTLNLFLMHNELKYCNKFYSFAWEISKPCFWNDWQKWKLSKLPAFERYVLFLQHIVFHANNLPRKNKKRVPYLINL